MRLQKLKKGDTIGVIAPASGDNLKNLEENINVFKNLGFNIKEGKYLRKKNEYLAGSDKERAEDLMNMFKDKNVKAIVAYRGGYGCIRMLPYLDLSTIKKNPKILCGYSDLTVLLNYITKKTGMTTFHGPMVNSKIFLNRETKNSFLSMLKDNSNFIEIPIKKSDFINKKSFKGSICGGNLSVICNSIGTPYEIDTNNKILMLEDVNEENYSIDRSLMQLKLSKKLEKCNGFLLGQFTPNNPSTLKSILSILVPYNKPILYNLPFGHDYPNLTIPIGGILNFNKEDNHLKIKY